MISTSQDISKQADIETKYLRLDKQIPKTFKDSLNNSLMRRYCNPFRFSNNIITSNNRLSDPLNPVCPDLGYTPYEQAMYHLCNKFNIDVAYTVKDARSKSSECLLNITYDIQQKNLTCDILAGISITQKIQKICDPKTTISISNIKCKEYYNELIQQKSCKYSYNQYKDLLSLGFMPEVINIAVSNNIYISPDGKYLTTKTNEYNLANELCFNNISLEGIGNRNEFLEKVITDLPKDLKQEILNSI